MPKQIVIAEQHRIAAVFSEDQIQELIVATGTHQVSDIYLGIVENVLPGIDAAFVNIGDSERNGFIHVTDLGPLRLKRSAGSITELLAPQQKVLVQVMKEPTGNKGPRLTGNISLPGRYLVLMPFGQRVNLSRRIRNENERNRLRALAVLIKPAGMGLVVRTEAENVSEEAIIEDLDMLQRQWDAIFQEANSTRAPALLNRDDDFIQRVLRDVYSSDVNRIVVDSHTGLKRVKQQLTSWSNGRVPQGLLVDHHRDRIPLLEYFRVNAAIREALKPRVDLPSGGYIIIERTEALTVIDVNSGSFTRSATARETVLWTNCEAATEIARQLRLRNIAGVIIVDFIDMDQRRDQLQVLEHFNKALRADKAKPQIAQLSELGLVELTRKRQGKNIYELFGRACPTCGGLGHLVHLPGEPEDAEGDIIERPVASAVREYRGAESRTVDLRSRNRGRDLPPREEIPSDFDSSEPLWEGGEDAEDASNEDVDLLNHPSYQERGGNNRRRRRRRVGDELPAKGGAYKESLPRDTSSRSVPWEETSRPITRASAAAAIAARAEVSEPELLPTEEPLAPVRSERGEKEERRGKFKRDTAKAASEPPEYIAVEMTPEEQDVYAWMGISPLILYTQEVKNPKSALITVVAPGEAATLTLPTATPLSQMAALESSPALVNEVTDVEATGSASVEGGVGAVEIDGESAAELGASESASEESVNRRRRRRSSATATE